MIFRKTIHGAGMRIKLTSVMVDDQDKAKRFYTDILGFVKKQDFPVGEYRWITVSTTHACGPGHARRVRRHVRQPHSALSANEIGRRGSGDTIATEVRVLTTDLELIGWRQS